MPNLTPEQRAKIGQFKAAGHALVDEMVERMLRCPRLLQGADFIRLEVLHHSGKGRRPGWGMRVPLDTPE